MKELTIKQKAKAYDKAIEKAQKELRACGSTDCDAAKQIFRFFPELRESEDERIRGAIIHFISHTPTVPKGIIDKEIMIAWLEKQTENDSNKMPIWKHWKDGIAGNGEGKPIYLVKIGNTYSLNSCLGFECDYIELSELDNLMLEKQRHTDGIIEKAKTEKQRVIITETDGNANIDWDTRSLEDAKRLLECGLQYINTEIEKQSKPKFKIGDWIINHQTGLIKHIKNVLLCGINGIYEFESSSMPIDYVDNAFHLWAIQDAKDGDVLFAENFDNIGGCVFLFKGLDSWRFDAEGDRAIATGYCCTSITESGNTDFGIQGPDCVEIKRVHPATKEQRDTLFAKMKKSGYKWDAKKKELKLLITNGGDITGEPDNKIESFDEFAGLTDFERTLADICIGWIGEEPGWKQYIKDNAEALLKIAIEKFNSVQDAPFEQKSSWSEVDEEHLNSIISDIKTDMGAYPRSQEVIDIYNDDISFLKSLRDRVQPQPKQEWSEEDEYMLNETIQHLEELIRIDKAKHLGCDVQYYQRDIDWLKSLKERYGWKPSEEQIRTLEYYMHNLVCSEHKEVLFGLYEQLKKLKGE